MMQPARSRCAGARLLRSRVWITVLLLMLVVTGCASVPDGGPVQQAAVGVGVEQPVVRRLAPPPRPGADPQEIVQGFLLASADFANQATALRFLTPAAQDRWNRDAGVVVMQSSLQQAGAAAGPAEQNSTSASPSAATVETRTVSLTGRQVASIDSSWSFRQFPNPQAVSIRMGLVRDTRNGGEWRIDTLPDGVYLPSYEMERTFRAAVVYFSDPAMTHLVPVPVVVPVSSTMVAVLVQRVVQGPGQGLSAGLASAVPPGVRLRQPVTQSSEGLVQVQLEHTAPMPQPSVQGDTHQLLAAQLLATLAQISTVNAVQVSVDGAVVTGIGPGQELGADTVQRYNPEVPMATPTPLLAVQNARLGRVEEQNWSPVPGFAGSSEANVSTAAMSLDATQVAGVSSDGTRLYSGRTSGEEFLLRYTGVGLGDPSFDSTGTVWMVEAGSSAQAPTVVGITPQNHHLLVDVSSLPGRVRVARVSRDGLRVAVVVRVEGQDQLWIASLMFPAAGPAPEGGWQQQRQTVALAGAGRVAAPLLDIADVAWQDSQTVVALAAKSRSVRQPYVLSLDGFTVDERSPLPFNPARVSAAPGLPLVVASAQDNARLYRSAGTTWQRDARGGDPSYPG